MDRMFANSSGDWNSIPDQVIPKTQKMLLDTSLLNTQHYQVRVKGRGAIQGKKLRLQLPILLYFTFFVHTIHLS